MRLVIIRRNFERLIDIIIVLNSVMCSFLMPNNYGILSKKTFSGLDSKFRVIHVETHTPF